MAPKRKILGTKKSTNLKRSKVVDDVAQKQPTKTTVETSVKETSGSTILGEAPPSVQPRPFSRVVPPTKPQTVSVCLILFLKFRVKKIQFLVVKFGFLFVEVSHLY